MEHPAEHRVLVAFRSRLRDDVPDEYWSLSQELEGLARAIDGFVEYKVFTAPDGERLSLVIFDSMEAENEWREHLAHRSAQQRGREHFYEAYDVSVCEVQRSHRWQRDPG